MNSFIIITNYFSKSNKFNSYLNKQYFQACSDIKIYEMFDLFFHFNVRRLILLEIKKLIKFKNRINDIGNINKKITTNILNLLSFMNLLKRVIF